MMNNQVDRLFLLIQRKTLLGRLKDSTLFQYTLNVVQFLHVNQAADRKM